MKRKLILRLLALLAAATGFYASSTSTARSDKAILRAEFGVPPSAKVVHYKAAPDIGLIPLPREGLDIEVVFNLTPVDITTMSGGQNHKGTGNHSRFRKVSFLQQAPSSHYRWNRLTGFFNAGPPEMTFCMLRRR